jgi:tetratricopeptide (TPR) repeat protein
VEATRLVEYIATLHLARAITRCQQQAFAASFADFQHMATLPYPERSLEQARAEAAWCRLAFAKVLTTQERFEAASEQLQRVISTEQGAIREAALKLVPVVVGEDIRAWVTRQQYAQAFQRLGQYQASFGEYPETASFFADLGSQIEYDVFGVVLTRQCRQTVQPLPKVEKPVNKGTRKPSPPPQGAVIMAAAPEAGPIDSDSTANLLLRNDTGHRLQILVRGQAQRDVLLEPQATQELQLDAAEYVVGVYAPGNCRLQPRRSTWTIRSWAPYSVRFYEG